MPATPEPATASSATTITVYWRPGCPFCTRLLRWIDRAGVPTTRRNIWEDPEASAALRAITGGDETVPTVTIGQGAMVNPSPRALQAAIEAEAPELLAAGIAGTAPARRWWTRPARSA